MSGEQGTVLDWRWLAEAPKVHYCDCDYCEMNGEPDEPAWPTLVRLSRGGVPYVTDRYIMILADRAPIPRDYEGPVLEGPALGDQWPEAVTDKAADQPFGPSVRQAVKRTGWRLMLLAHPDGASKGALKRVGVVAEDGEHIGWAIADRPTP